MVANQKVGSSNLSGRSIINICMMRFKEFYLNEYEANPRLGDFAPATYRLKSVEEFADKLFAKFGIDVEFTRHFKQRLKQMCFDEDVSGRLTAADLKDLFEKAFQKHANVINKIITSVKDVEGIFKDIQRILNIPFKIEHSKDKNLPFILVAKTISSKKDFKSKDHFYFV